MTPRRRTKIVATLGPATDAPGVLDAAGRRRHGLRAAELLARDARRPAAARAAVRAAAERAGRPLGLLFDLQGPKLRLSAETEPRVVAAGDVVTLLRRRRRATATSASSSTSTASPRSSPSARRSSSATACRGSRSSASDRATSSPRAVSPGPLSPRKGINVTYARPELPAITEKDVADLALAAELGADFVALSFVRSAADIEQLRARCASSAGARA